MRGLAASLVTSLALAGCYASHTRPPDALDAATPRDGGDGVADGGGNDGPADAGAGIDADAGPIDCGYVAGFRRCDERCPLPCTATDGRCAEAFGVCRPRFPSGYREDGCLWAAHGGRYAPTGNPCAVVRGTGAPGDPWSGLAMPVEFCLAAPDAGLPSTFTCLYSDGTPLVTGPPPGDCPPSDPENPFCGGSCGTEAACLYGVDNPRSCVGLSDTRSHGVCMVDMAAFCNTANVGTWLQARVLEGCAEATGRECACLVLRPQAFPGTEVGFPMIRSACAAYRARFPETSCVDADFAELP